MNIAMSMDIFQQPEDMNPAKTGFIAHMDTVSDFCDHPVTPVITPNYDGKDLALGTSGRVLSPKMFPHLSTLKGRTLITSDGTTILGADDKAGIAEIMTIIEHLNDNTIPHGPLCIAFTPDEEIGMGPAHFNVKKFGADFAYNTCMVIQKVKSSMKTLMLPERRLI